MGKEQFTNKEEALEALKELAGKKARTVEEVSELEQLTLKASNAAIELGASDHDISFVWFAGTPPEERQILFDVFMEEIRGAGTLEEKLEYIQSLIRIRDEFGLQE